jgi:STE24 endopeptidase
VWSLKQYLGFHVRHNLLLIAAPMFGVLVLRDAEPDYRAHLTRWTGQPVSGQLAFLAGVGLIFLFSPFLLRYIWSTEVLPAGELRDRLERLCSRVGLRYRQILIWQTGGVMVNGAVMGLFAPLRYILLSDGLLESMEDDKIEAVFGHEAGHVKHHHIPYYLAFAVLSMLIAGGVLLLLLAWLDAADPVAEGLTGSASRMLLAVVPDRSSYLIQVSPILLVAVMWLVGFGWISRRFERQADLFGALTVTPEPDHCIRDCVVHHPQDGNTTQDPHALCGTAAELFAEALETIALLNGINPKSRSWRHSSIAYRAAFLRRLATEPARVRTFQGVVRNIKIVLFVGTAVALAVTVVLYLTGQLPPELVGVY